MSEFLRGFLFILQTLVSVALIALVVAQTHRSEGLGAVTGQSGPVRGRAGMEEQLAIYTRYAIVAFMALSALLYLLGEKFRWH